METLHKVIFLIVMVLLIRWLFYSDEGFYGAITQLRAKGPQDLYLTVDTEKYVYPRRYYRYPYDEYIWNNPTRYRQPYYFWDYTYHLFPYFYTWY
jgi:hypothetical protein